MKELQLTEDEAWAISENYSRRDIDDCIEYAKTNDKINDAYDWAKKALIDGTWTRRKKIDHESREWRLKFLEWLPEQQRNVYGHYD